MLAFSVARPSLEDTYLRLVGGRPVAIREIGEGVPILFLHGFGVDHVSLLSSVAPVFERKLMLAKSRPTTELVGATRMGTGLPRPGSTECSWSKSRLRSFGFSLCLDNVATTISAPART